MFKLNKKILKYKKYIFKIQTYKEELDFIKEDLNNEWVSTNNIKYIKEEAKIIAKNTIKNMKKNKSITIRINDNLLNKIKAKSLAIGIPYQTLITQKLSELAFSY